MAMMDDGRGDETTKAVEGYCFVCDNRGTRTCRVCVYRTHPSGKVARPSHWAYCALYDVRSGEKEKETKLQSRMAHEVERVRVLEKWIMRRCLDRKFIPFDWVIEHNERLESVLCAESDESSPSEG